MAPLTRKTAALGRPAKAKRATAKPAKARAATTVDEFIAGAPAGKRAAMKKVRKAIKAAAPKAVEGIGYGIAGYKYKGQPLIYFGYGKDHCALYGSVDYIAEHVAELRGYKLSKGTLRFPPDSPPPDSLVTKIVKERIAAIEKSGR